MKVHCVSITFCISFEWSCKVLNGLGLGKLGLRVGRQKSETRSSVKYQSGLEPVVQARALSIIFSQMPLDLRISSTSSRAAPLPPFALVM